MRKLLLLEGTLNNMKCFTAGWAKGRKEPDFSSGYAFTPLKTGFHPILPFEITRRVRCGAAYELALPPQCRMHPVIPTMHLEPAPPSNAVPRQRALALVKPSVTETGEYEWEIEILLTKRKVGARGKHRKEYLVRWKG